MQNALLKTYVKTMREKSQKLFYVLANVGRQMKQLVLIHFKNCKSF